MSLFTFLNVATKIFLNPALAGVAQWIECSPTNLKVAGSIPSRARVWVVGQVPSWGRVRGKPMDVSLTH